MKTNKGGTKKGRLAETAGRRVGEGGKSQNEPADQGLDGKTYEQLPKCFDSRMCFAQGHSQSKASWHLSSYQRCTCHANQASDTSWSQDLVNLQRLKRAQISCICHFMQHCRSHWISKVDGLVHLFDDHPSQQLLPLQTHLFWNYLHQVNTPK